MGSAIISSVGSLSFTLILIVPHLYAKVDAGKVVVLARSADGGALLTTPLLQTDAQHLTQTLHHHRSFDVLYANLPSARLRKNSQGKVSPI